MKQIKKKSDKILILHLANGLRIGGAEVMLLYYIKALGFEKYDHYVYFFGADGPIRKKIESLEVPVFRGKRRASIKNPAKFGWSLYRLFKDIISFVKRKNVNILISHLRQANQLAVVLGKMSGIPVFPVVHNTMAFQDRRTNLDPRVPLLKIVDEFIYCVSDCTIAVSSEIKEIIQRKFRLIDSKIIVVKNGIILDNGLPEASDLEKEFPESKNKLKILAVGSLSYQKAFEVLVKAVAEVVCYGQVSIFILIAGGGEELIYLENLIKDLSVTKYIRLLGIRNDVFQLMKAADLFVMSSRYEGLSIAMIEAMACGLPIIASDAPGIKGHIEDGENGLLFPIGDYQVLAKRILQLADDKDLRDRLSRGALEAFVREYDMRQNIKPLDILIQKYAVLC